MLARKQWQNWGGGQGGRTKQGRQVTVRPVGVLAILQALDTAFEPPPLFCGIVLVVSADDVRRTGGLGCAILRRAHGLAL